jgi:pimeloyl-ACP methyl ester carboxylesterase
MGGLAALMLAADHPGLAGRVMVVDAMPFIGTIFGADSVEALRPRAERMRAMLLTQAAKVNPDFSLTADCPDTLPAPAVPAGNMTNSGPGACLARHGARVSDLRVVAQAMYDDMVTDVTPRLSAIKVPVTMLYPQDERLLTAPAAAKLYGEAYATLPGVRLVRIPGSYHFIMQDQPRAFADALDSFLK